MEAGVGSTTASVRVGADWHRIGSGKEQRGTRVSPPSPQQGGISGVNLSGVFVREGVASLVTVFDGISMRPLQLQAG